MRHQDLRRPRGIESLWLRLKLAAHPLAPRPARSVDLAHLSDHLLQDMGLERREDGRGDARVRRLRP